MYATIPFLPFFMGLMIISIPVAVMEYSGEKKAANAYLGLFLLAMLIFNWRGVEAFSEFVRREI